MPGSGLTYTRTQETISRARPKREIDWKISFKLPKQWRHVSVVVLAASLAVVGFEKHSEASPATVNADTSTSQSISTQPQVQLPSISSITLPPVPVKKEGVKEPFVAASNVMLFDEASKVPLYEKQSKRRVAIASTTKIASAIVALEHYELDKKINISQEASSAIGSAVTFRIGEEATIRQLLHGLLIVSGNDAAYALAEQMAQPGDTNKTQRFVDEMNTLAKKLGLTDTHFYDPAGLNDAGYSTASDMAQLLSYAIDNRSFREIVKLGDYAYTSPEGYLHTFKNSNRLVVDETRYPGIIGGKTGYTPKTTEGGAGHCLVVAAERDGHRLIAVVLDTHDQTPQASAEVARSLFEYGFNNFTWQEIAR